MNLQYIFLKAFQFSLNGVLISFYFRLCAVVHVLFTALNYYLKEEEQQDECNSIPLEIGIETARTVEQIVNYFASQRQVINKVIELD